MKTPIFVPELGAENQPIRISNWLVDHGDAVLQEERIVELSLPGITFDVGSPVAGKLDQMNKQIEDLVNPGDVLGWIIEH